MPPRVNAVAPPSRANLSAVPPNAPTQRGNAPQADGVRAGAPDAGAEREAVPQDFHPSAFELGRTLWTSLPPHARMAAEALAITVLSGAVGHMVDVSPIAAGAMAVWPAVVGSALHQGVPLDDLLEGFRDRYRWMPAAPPAVGDEWNEVAGELVGAAAGGLLGAAAGRALHSLLDHASLTPEASMQLREQLTIMLGTGGAVAGGVAYAFRGTLQDAARWFVNFLRAAQEAAAGPAAAHR